MNRLSEEANNRFWELSEQFNVEIAKLRDDNPQEHDETIDKIGQILREELKIIGD